MLRHSRTQAMEASRLYVATVDSFCTNWWQLLTAGGDAAKLSIIHSEVRALTIAREWSSRWHHRAVPR
jgi:hypothetical protein